MSYGEKTVVDGKNTYADGAAAPVSDLVTADAALPAAVGVTDDDVKFLVKQMIDLKTYAQACAALIAGRPQKLQPAQAVLGRFQALVTARAAMNPPYYPQ